MTNSFGSAPKVTVVIPTYGHRDTVLATLDSVFAQDYPDFEVVVVNDGSPDDTGELLQPLVRARRIRYIEQENRGQGGARNRGLEEARGALVAFLDDDDLWPANKLSWQAASLGADRDAVLVYGDHAKLLPDGSIVHPPRMDRPHGDAHARFRLRNWMMSPGQTLIRRETLERIGGFDEEIWGSDDWDLYIRLAAEGPFRYEPRTALLYRVHEGAASRQAVRHARNHLKVVRNHIGLNVPLLVRHQWLAKGYFEPNLRMYADSARAQSHHREALTADIYSLAFRPTLLFRPGFYLRAARSLWGLARDWS